MFEVAAGARDVLRMEGAGTSVGVLTAECISGSPRTVEVCAAETFVLQVSIGAVAGNLGDRTVFGLEVRRVHRPAASSEDGGTKVGLLRLVGVCTDWFGSPEVDNVCPLVVLDVTVQRLSNGLGCNREFQCTFEWRLRN